MKQLIDRLLAMFRRPLRPTLPDDESVSAMIARIRAAHLSYCGFPKMENIAECMLDIRRRGVPGSILEAGVALGGSAILLGWLKPPGVPLDLFDVFAMIPPPGERDGEDAHRRYQEIRSGNSAGLGGKTYYGYVDDLLDAVKGNLRGFGLDVDGGDIRFHPGLFEDTLHPAAPVALAHIDCDWYDSVQVCIQRIAPRLPVGGVIIFDDYSSYSGCRRAVDEWLAAAPAMEKIFERRSLGVRRRS